MFRALICSLLSLCLGFEAWPQAQPSSASVEVRIIVVDSSSQADRVVQRLKNGEDFAEIAQTVSIDPTASDGGYMGRIDPATLRPEFRDAIKGLTAGQISGVVHSNSGYAILKVISPSEAVPLQNTAPARILPSSAAGTIRYAPNVGGKKERQISHIAISPNRTDGIRICASYATSGSNLSQR